MVQLILDLVIHPYFQLIKIEELCAQKKKKRLVYEYCKYLWYLGCYQLWLSGAEEKWRALQYVDLEKVI